MLSLAYCLSKFARDDMQRLSITDIIFFYQFLSVVNSVVLTEWWTDSTYNTKRSEW